MNEIDNWHDLKYHELCTLFPPMSGEEYDILKDSMETNGYIKSEPIVLVHGETSEDPPLILDGRNRHQAAMDSRVTPTFEFLPDNVEPLHWVSARNLSRRMLTTGQRASIASEMANLGSGQNAMYGVSIDEAAKICGVAPASVSHYRTVQNRDENAARDVKYGNTTLRAAYQAVKATQGPEGGGQKPSEAKPVTLAVAPDNTAVIEKSEPVVSPEDLDKPEEPALLPGKIDPDEKLGSTNMEFDGKSEPKANAHWDPSTGRVVIQIDNVYHSFRADTAALLGEKIIDAAEQGL